MDSMMGDNSAYFSAVDSDEDADKTLENNDSASATEPAAPSPAINKNVSKKTPKRVSFIATSTNRYSSLTKKTIHREFQKALTNGGISAGTVNRKSDTWQVTNLNGTTDNKENKENVHQNDAPEMASQKLPNKNDNANVEDVLAVVPPSVANSKTVLGANVEAVTAISAPARQCDDEQMESVANVEVTVVKRTVNLQPAEEVIKSGDNRNTVKNAKQKLIDDTKKHQSRMSMFNRPIVTAPKPTNTRKSMAVMRQVLAKARQSLSTNQMTNPAGKSGRTK